MARNDANLMERTAEQVEKVIVNAKLNPDELHRETQAVFFSSNFDNSNIKLLELDSELLESLEAGTSLVIRGDKNEHAVVCTSSKTYELKEAETSNSLLLLPQCKLACDLEDCGSDVTRKVTPVTVSAMLHQYYELRPCKPRLQKLRRMLSENVYRGTEYELMDNDSGRKYTFDDLLDQIQASEEEILTALENLHACEIDGYWRMLDFDYTSAVVNRILSYVEENSWSRAAVPLAATLDVLQELEPRRVLRRCMRWFGRRASSSSPPPADGASDAEDAVVSLDEDKICRMFAEELLRPTRNFNFNEFMMAWKQAVPEGMTTSLNQIQDIAIIDRTCHPIVLKYFPVVELPEGLQERLSALFAAKEKWTFEEIRPFVQDLATDSMDVNALLTKYTRSSMQNGIKNYSSKGPR